MHDIFIAHVEEDANVALEIALGLEEVGYTTWCYEVDSIPGQSYLIQTGRAVEESKVVVVVISPHSLSSRQVTREVVRAHESGREFIPMLRGITHVEFQNRQPEWREAIGAAASIKIPREGATRIIPRVIDGLKGLSILPTSKINATRIMQVRKALAEVQGGDVGEKAEELPTLAKRIGAKAVTVGKRPTISAWLWVAIALLGLSFLLLMIATIGYPAPINPQQPWYEYFFGILIIAILFIVPGVYCLRRGISQAGGAKPAQGKIPSWWWFLPIILAFVGGIISWARQKDANRRQAANMLALGIVLSVFWVIPFLVLQAPVVPSTSPEPPAASEPPAPEPETPEEETPVPSPSLSYEDDFSNPHSGWISESREDREEIYKDGEYHILVKKYDWAACVWNRNAGQFADFTLEIDARLISGPNQSSYGVIFRVQHTLAENYYRFLVSENGYYLIGTRTNDIWTVLQDWEKSDFIETGNSTNHLKVVCQGSQIEVYVNEHHLATVTDDAFASGYVGIIVDTPEPDTLVAFDNISIYSLD
jgi:hypothetical protein